MPDEPEAPGYRIQTSQLQGRTTEMEQHKIPSQRDDVITQREQDSDRERPSKMLRVDIQHKPQDFLRAAKEVPHPMAPHRVLPDAIKAVLFDNRTMEPPELAKSRMRAVLTIKESSAC